MSNLYTFQNSIIEGSTTPLDTYAPVSFLTWFNQKNYTTVDLDALFLQYKQYIIEWGRTKKVNAAKVNETIRDSYIQVLRELIIDYSTEEEKRFITNADLSDPSDLDIVLPFFINKIKQVCLYYANTRENLKTAQIQHNLRGSNYGIENLVKQLIFDAAQTNQVVFAQTTCNFPPISSIARQLSIYIEELYDLKSDYYNQGTPSPTKSTDIVNLATPNKAYERLYIDFKQAIIDAIRQYPFYITSLGINNFTVNPYLSGTELNYLKNRDFITYLSGGTEDLKLNLYKRLAPKYLGNDFYYLSTGSTRTNFVSGLLFSVKPLTGAPTLNLLNRQTPSVASVPSLEHLYTEYEIGRFFLPQHQGLLIHNTPHKKYSLDATQLQPNTVYAFPDPDIVGNTSYNSTQDNFLAPITYTVDVSWNKRSRSNQFAFGDVLSTSYNQLYYGYESREQDLHLDVSGLSRTYDNVQFWEGVRQEQWANSDIWPGLSKQETLPLSDRQASLLVNDYTPVYWGSDIYNNEYGLLKKVSALKAASATADSNGVMSNRNTAVAAGDAVVDQSIAAKKVLIPGKLYFRNSITNTVSPGSAALSAVFFKYPAAVKQEINESLHYFNMYYDTFVLETKNYVVVDTVIFDYDTQQITINSNPGTFFQKSLLNPKLEKFAGEWYSEYDKSLYLCFLTLGNRLSSSNYKLLYPKIYRTPLTNIKLSVVYPDPRNDITDMYSISAGFIEPPQMDLYEIDGVSFSRLEKNNLFNLTYLAKNTNSMPFFVNEQIQKNDPYYSSYEPEIFKPFYFIYDNNYSNPMLPFMVKYNASSTGTMGAHLPGEKILDVGQENIYNTTYLYSDGIKPLQINNIGRYIIQFDWESYSETSIFLGCNYYKVRNIGNDLIWNADTNDAQLLDTYNIDYFGSYREEIRSTTQIFSTFAFGTSGLDTTLTVNSGHLAVPFLSGQKTFIVNLNWTPSLTADHQPESYAAAGLPLEPRVIPPFSRLALEFSLLSGETVYFVDSFTNDTTATITLCSAVDRDYPAGQTVYFYNWLDRIENINYQVLIGTLSAMVKRPVYPDPSVLEINLTTSIPGFTGLICDAPESIYRPVIITKAGTGTGIVLSDPFCVNCGDLCTESFGYGTTLTLIASADFFSAFNRWEGGSCNMLNTDCIFTVTTAESITAYFDALPYYFVTVTTPAGRVISQDLKFIIDGPGSVTNPYLVGSVLTLSALKPVSGWAMFGYDGSSTCVDQTEFCSFAISSDVNIDVLYIRYYEYDVAVTTVPINSAYGYLGDISVTTNYPWFYYICSSSCTYTFTGTNTLEWGNQTITLSGMPRPGYKLKYWRGAPCGETEFYTSTYVDGPTNLVNAGDQCIFEATENRSITGVFDIGYYSLNITISGFGIGRVFTSDEGINYLNEDGSFTKSYAVLSGTTFTLYASAFTGSSMLGLSSRYCSPVFGVSTCNITMDRDVDVIVEMFASNFYTLTMNLCTCGVSVTSYPTSLGGSLSCPSTCSALYPAGRIVNLDEFNATESCYIRTFTGDGVYYQYTPGAGVTIVGAGTTFASGDTFGLIDSTIILTPEGAPYTTGAGIIVTPDAFVSMTENRSVTAVLV